MQFSNSKVQEQYDICFERINPIEDEHNIHLSISDVLNAHFLVVEFFLELGKGIGGIGVKNHNLLCSALSRQNACYGNVCKYMGVFDIAGALLYGLVKNHPFYDTNKRTAFLSILYYLYKNHYTPNVSHKEFEDFIVDIANNEIQKKRRYKKLARKSESPEVDYISWYLKKNTRKIDKKEYLVSYRELTKILQSFGFDLTNPSNGSIDVVKLKKTKSLFSRKNIITKKKIGRIPFPGNNKQVSKHLLSKVRKLTGLTEDNGFDSQVFYRDLDPLSILISKYEEPLRRLADR